MATAAGTSYQQLLDAVAGYYGTGSDQWVEVAKYGLKADNMAEILRQVPGVQAHVNKSGAVIGYSVDSNVALNDGGVSLPAVNSNVQTGTAAANNTTTVKTLGNFASDQQTGDISATNKIPKKTGGIAGTAEAIVGTVSAVTVGAGIGLTLGRAVNNAIYDNNPNFWYDLTDTPEGSEAAEEWAKITALYDEVDKDGKITHFLNVIAGLDDNSKSTVYVDENALAYYAWQLSNIGFFATGGKNADATISESTRAVVITPPVYFADAVGCTYTFNYASTVRKYTVTAAPAGAKVMAGIASSLTGTVYVTMYAPDTGTAESYTIVEERYNKNTGELVGTYTNTYTLTRVTSDSNAATYNGVPTVPYQYKQQIHQNGYNMTADSYVVLPCALTPSTGVSWSSKERNDAAWFLLHGTVHEGGMPGVETDPGATVPITTGWDSPAATLASLKNQYPSMWENAYQNDVYDPEGNLKTTNYVPIALPANYPNGNPVTVDDPSNQSHPAVDPDNPSVTDELLRTIIGILTKPATDPATITDPKTDDPTNTDPNPPDTGGGQTPPIVVPVGSASALWAVYNPTQAEINALGAWLWSNNFVDQLLKMFNDPMQAIIGLHKTFIPPSTGAAQDIKVGYLNSGVSSLTVPVQYTSVDCGTIDCAEYFGNVFDYAPYTKVYLYLPFIGFKELDVAQVMRGRINVKYHGDAFTGCCLAEVSVTRDGDAGGVLYTYSGDCAARYPLSHGSYMGIVNAIAGIGIGIGTALAGAPSIGIAGAVGMAQHARATVEHSGSFSGNSGAMGIKKPYLVVMRPQTAMANNYEHFTGQPSNSNVVLGSAHGYVRVKECHVEDIATATDAEKQMIETALKTGVII